MFSLQWVVNSTVDRFFWGGSSFGQRRFDNCTIFFLIGLAAFFDVIPGWLGILIAAAGEIWTMSLFFAAQTINLNHYYTPDQLLAAVGRAPVRINLLESVPPNFKVAVLTVFVVIVILYAILAIAIRAKPDVVAGTFCILIAGWLVMCGLNDHAHLDAWSNVIVKNRALGASGGALRDRLALMRDEEDYLRRTGNVAAANTTANEIKEIAAHATISGLR